LLWEESKIKRHRNSVWFLMGVVSVITAAAIIIITTLLPALETSVVKSKPSGPCINVRS
jgi:type IV secretory pathway component VirB8